MENEFLKIGILAGRGSDIFKFVYKPVGIDLMLKLDKDIINPAEVFSQDRSTTNQFEDYYYGGMAGNFTEQSTYGLSRSPIGATWGSFPDSMGLCHCRKHPCRSNP